MLRTSKWHALLIRNNSNDINQHINAIFQNRRFNTMRRLWVLVWSKKKQAMKKKMALLWAIKILPTLCDSEFFELKTFEKTFRISMEFSDVCCEVTIKFPFNTTYLSARLQKLLKGIHSIAKLREFNYLLNLPSWLITNTMVSWFSKSFN